jgi:hypothetical protein
MTNTSSVLDDLSRLYNISNHTGTEAELLTKSFQTFSFHRNNSKWVTFAIRSRGACGKLFQMKMYYYECKETFINGTHFQKTLSPTSGFKKITGDCSVNSLQLHNSTNLNGFCYSNGSWSIDQETEVSGCLCIEGYYPSKTKGCSRK